MRRRHRAELLFDLGPHRHRIDADVVAVEARKEDLAAVLALHERPEHAGHLESSLVIDPGGLMTPKHEVSPKSAHFSPQNSTGDSREASAGCQPQNPANQ